MADIQLIGTTNQGGTNLPTTYIYYSKFTCDFSGNCTSIKVWPLANTNVMCAIYTDNGGHPLTLLNHSASTAVTTGAWRSVSIPTTTLIAGTPYWLAVRSEAAGGTAYDVSGVQNEYEAYAYGDFPATATPTEQDAILISLQGWGTALNFLDFDVAANADDTTVYYTVATSTWTILDDAFTRIGYYSAAFERMGSAFRFLGVTIPAGATVTVSNLKIKCQLYASSGTVVRAKISAEQSVAAAAFSTIANYQARTRTTAVVTTTSADAGLTAWAVGTTYTSKDFAAVIQELVDDYGGLSNANIVIFYGDEDDLSDNNADCYRYGEAYNDADTVPPHLHIEYTTAGWAHIGEYLDVAAANMSEILDAPVANISELQDVAV